MNVKGSVEPRKMETLVDFSQRYFEAVSRVEQAGGEELVTVRKIL